MIGRLIGWIFFLAGLSVLVRDVLVWAELSPNFGDGLKDQAAAWA
jgi:hypothetical protein